MADLGPCTCGSTDGKHPLDCKVWNHPSQVERSLRRNRVRFDPDVDRMMDEISNSVASKKPNPVPDPYVCAECGCSRADHVVAINGGCDTEDCPCPGFEPWGVPPFVDEQPIGPSVVRDRTTNITVLTPEQRDELCYQNGREAERARIEQIIEARHRVCANDAAHDGYNADQRADAASRADELRYIMEAIDRDE